MANLKLFFLGSSQLEVDGVATGCDSRKGLALLAYLAVTGHSHSRDALSTLLWPDSDQSRARSYLRHALWSLKKVLGKGWLEVSREQVGLHPEADIWLDVSAFHQDLAAIADTDAEGLTRLAGAVERYRDDFLSGFTLPDAPAFDEWQFFMAGNGRLA
jgi:DNA-binding SARP family transcriptional activator